MNKHIATWQERRIEYFKRYSDSRHGPESNDQFMLAEIVELRAIIQVLEKLIGIWSKS